MALPDAYQARPLERSEVEEGLLANQLKQPDGVLDRGAAVP